MSYLKDNSFNETINYLYSPSLINTYEEMINDAQEAVEKNFLEMIKVQKDFTNKSDLVDAYLDFEKKMDDESYKNFLKIKNETIKD